MAGTVALVMVRLTGLAWLAPGTKAPATTYPVVTPALESRVDCWGMTLATGMLVVLLPPGLVGPELGS